MTNRSSLFFIFLSIIILLSFSKAIAKKRTLKIGINDQDNFPSMGKPGTENDPNPGILIENMRFVAKETGIKVKYIRLPWKRCLKALKAGEMDGLICGSYKKKREIFGAFPKTKDGKADVSKRFTDSSYYLYVKKSSNLKWDGKIFNRTNIRIGAERGFSIVPDLKKTGISVEELDSVRVNFYKLLMDRLDGVAAHESSGDVILLYRSDFKKIEPPLKTKAYYLMMSHRIYKSDPYLVKRLWNACGKMQLYEVKKIRAKYRGKRNWEEMY